MPSPGCHSPVNAEPNLALDRGDLPGADALERQQLVQQFFFHLIGGVEFTAQRVNAVRALDLAIDDVRPPALPENLRGPA